MHGDLAVIGCLPKKGLYPLTRSQPANRANFFVLFSAPVEYGLRAIAAAWDAAPSSLAAIHGTRPAAMPRGSVPRDRRSPPGRLRPAGELRFNSAAPRQSRRRRRIYARDRGAPRVSKLAAR